MSGEEAGTKILDLEDGEIFHKLANKNYMDYMSHERNHSSFGNRSPHE